MPPIVEFGARKSIYFSRSCFYERLHQQGKEYYQNEGWEVRKIDKASW